MKASPAIEFLVGAVLVGNFCLTLLAVFIRPKLLNHWLVRPRWFGVAGPLAGPVGAMFGAIVWLAFGLLLVWHSVGQLIGA